MLDAREVASVRHAFPDIAKHIHLNAATFGPLAQCAADAVTSWLRKETDEGRPGMAAYMAMATIYDEARSATARLLNVTREEIALTESTGEGMSIICNGFNWQPGDELIITDHEHISLLSLAYHIAQRYGVTLRVAELGLAGDGSAAEAIAGLITPRTRLIALSHISFRTGAVLDIAAITAQARQAGIPLLVDGAQAAGAIPLDLRALDVDFYAFPMQKWLCGPDGTGALYVKRDIQHTIHPTYVGWCSLKFMPAGPEGFAGPAQKSAGGNWDFLDTAQRFELGARQTAAVAGQVAVLQWLADTVTYDWIFERIASLHAYAYQALRAISGVTILTPQSGSSGVLTFTLDKHDADSAAKILQQEYQIYLRGIPQNNGLRVSTGFYNTVAEIDQLAQAVYTLQMS